MQERQELMNKLLDNANIPALSLSWCQQGTRQAVAYGRADTSTPKRVDTNTLFQAASLSKPVSSAIILDLVAQSQWDLDIPLADIADYGPPEIKQDPHYRMLTTRMIIGQCSGLANFGQDGDDGKKFIAKPNTRFTYSGVALDFLKHVVEQKTGKEWENIAQDFFKKVGMTSSTFLKILPDGNLNGIRRDIAKAHLVDPSPGGSHTPLPPLPDDDRGIPAGSMHTTAQDYITFLQYCFKNHYLKSTLLASALSTLPPTLSPESSQIHWGLGMGIYMDKESGKTIAFHWGNNTGSISFCAMNMTTGDCVVSFANSMNGPFVFQQIAEPIFGDLKPLFNWLSTYCSFNDVNRPIAPDYIAKTAQSIHALTFKDPTEDCIEITNQFKQDVRQLQTGNITSTNQSRVTPLVQ